MRTIKLVASAIAFALVGLFAGVQQAHAWNGSTVSDAQNKTVYLYNVGTQKFVGIGDRWGTMAIIHEVGVPFTLTTNSANTYNLLKSTIKQENGTTYGYMAFMDGTVSRYDTLNVFLDRASADTTSFLTFKEQDATSHYYQIIVRGRANSPAGATQRYLTAVDGDLMGEATADGDNSLWQIVTQDERNAAFTTAESSESKVVPAHFLIKDQGFSRHNLDVSNWKTYPSGDYTKDGALINYTTKFRSPSDATTDGYKYYIGNGYSESTVTIDSVSGETVDKQNMQMMYGGAWTANIHGSVGKVYQTITPLREGWYKVSCKAFTTTTTGTAKLFAYAANVTTLGKQYKEEALTTITDAPASYLAAAQLVDADDTNAYDKSVMVRVNKLDDGTLETLTFGIDVADADDDAWTCFDDFELLYYGDPKHTIVLDETQTSVDYINSQRKVKDTDGSYEEFADKRTLYLGRSLNVNTWNTIVLPVDLTMGQCKDAFGDQVCITEFKGACNADHPGRIYFTEVSALKDNDNATAIKAGSLYLIKPSSVENYTNSSEAVSPENDSNLSISKYFTIQGVTFYPGTDITANVKGGEGKEYYNEDNKIQFAGTYVYGKGIIPANSYVISGKQTTNSEVGLWYYRTATTTSKGFRGWLQPVSANAKGIEIDINGVVDLTLANGTTGIDDIAADDNNTISGNVYSISGTLVRPNATSLNGLPNGIYIVNGKKYVVK